MDKTQLLKEIEGFEKKSNFSNRKKIFILTALKLINNEAGYFSLSLFSTLFSFYIFGFNVFIGLVCHFIFWLFFSKKLIEKEKYKQENKSFDFLISTIKNHLKQKK
jgi:hypothetical protein